VNMLRTTIPLAALTALLVWGGDMIGGRQGVVLALIFAGVLNFFSYWYSDRVIMKMYRAKELGPNDDLELYGIVQDLAQRGGLPMPRVFAIPQGTPNAFATGRNPQHAAVAVTQGIRRILTKRELAGVLGHELAHVKYRDILISTIAVTLAGALKLYRTRGLNPRVRPKGRATASPLWKPHRLCARFKRRGYIESPISQGWPSGQ